MVMKFQGTAAALGLLVMGAWAHVLPSITQPPCDSPEAEAAALKAQDYINTHLKNGYKYILNRVDDIKITTTPDGAQIYHMELDLLETKCHVLDPTPLTQCIVRSKAETAVEGDCDVVLAKNGEALSVLAYKCKSEESAEDLCLGCSRLLPFNDTNGIRIASASLDLFNNQTGNATFALLEIGRFASQVVAGGARLMAEYAIIETNCTSPDDDDICVSLNHTVARHGFCHAEGVGPDVSVNCKIFASPMPSVDPVTNASLPAPPPVVLFAHTAGPAHSPVIHSHSHHKLTAMHDLSGRWLLSTESAESAEGVVPPEVVAPAPIVKREVFALNVTAMPPQPQLLVPVCPGKVKHF